MEQKAPELLQTYKTPQTSAERAAATWTAYIWFVVLAVIAAVLAWFLG